MEDLRVDIIVLIVAVLVLLFSAWFYNVSSDVSNNNTALVEERIDTKKEKQKEEVSVSYYANEVKIESKVVDIDAKPLQNLMKTTTESKVVTKPNEISKSHLGQDTSIHSATVINPYSNTVSGVQTHQMQPQDNTHKKSMSSSFSNSSSSNNNNVETFSTFTPPQVPIMANTNDAPPSLPNISAQAQNNSSNSVAAPSQQVATQDTTAKTTVSAPPSAPPSLPR